MDEEGGETNKGAVVGLCLKLIQFQAEPSQQSIARSWLLLREQKKQCLINKLSK